MVLILPEEASAVPAFARQTNMPCAACHFQNFPTLNPFGRAFRAGGYTMSVGQGLIAGDDISLPMVLNASVIAKLRYVKTDGNTNEDTDHGRIEWPDEAALLVGGRLAEKVGFLMELGLADVASEDGGDISANSFLSTKLHFNVFQAAGAQFSLIPFSTDGLGVGYGFELLNTGAQRSQRPIEERRGFSAAQALGLGSGEATGIALVASSNKFFLNYSPWVPGWGGTNMSVKPDGLAHYLRAVFMPSIGIWDIGFGVQAWTGDATVATDDGTGNKKDIVTDGWIIDAQAQGQVFDSMPLGLYASYGECNGDPEHFASNCTNADDANALALLAQLGVLPNKANIYVAYRTMDVGKAMDNTFDSWTVGVNYMANQNIRLELFNVFENGSGVDARTNDRDNKMVLQVFVGF
jgi:hypothetical protein